MLVTSAGASQLNVPTCVNVSIFSVFAGAYVCSELARVARVGRFRNDRYAPRYS